MIVLIADWMKNAVAMQIWRFDDELFEKLHGELAWQVILANVLERIMLAINIVHAGTEVPRICIDGQTPEWGCGSRGVEYGAQKIARDKPVLAGVNLSC